MEQGRHSPRLEPSTDGVPCADHRRGPDGEDRPASSDWDAPWGGADGYILIYLGAGQSRFRMVTAAPGTKYLVDVIDTWNMTIERFDHPMAGTFRVELPGRPFIALRLVAV